MTGYGVRLASVRATSPQVRISMVCRGGSEARWDDAVAGAAPPAAHPPAAARCRLSHGPAVLNSELSPF